MGGNTDFVVKNGIQTKDGFLNYQGGSGKLGVGRTNPDATLSVNGTANVSGVVTLGNTLGVAGQSAFVGNGTFYNYLTIGNSSVNTSANSTWLQTINFSVNNVVANSIIANSLITVGTSQLFPTYGSLQNLYVTGISTLEGLTILGSAYNSNAIPNFGQGLAIGWNYTQGSGEVDYFCGFPYGGHYFYTRVNNSVVTLDGIIGPGGATFPTGPVTATQFMCSSTGYNFVAPYYAHYADSSNYYIFLTGNSTGPADTLTAARPFYINLSTARVYMSNGVSISSGLSVDHANATNFYSAVFSLDNETYSYGGGSRYYYGLDWGIDNTDGWSLSTGPVASLGGYGGVKLFTRGAPRLSISPDGNTGIGVTNAQALLDVNGTGHFSGTLSVAANVSAPQFISPAYGYQFAAPGYGHYSDGVNYCLVRTTNTAAPVDVATDVPFVMTLANGHITIGDGLTVVGGLTADSINSTSTVTASEFVCTGSPGNQIKGPGYIMRADGSQFYIMTTGTSTITDTWSLYPFYINLSNGYINMPYGATIGTGLTLSGSTVAGPGSAHSYGAITIQGAKNTYGGINFANSTGGNLGTLMVGPGDISGMYNAADGAWNWYFSGGTLNVNAVNTTSVAVGTNSTINSTGFFHNGTNIGAGPGGAKAWLYSDGTSIISSYNIASITNSGASAYVYTVTFTTPLSSNTYAVLFHSDYSGSVTLYGTTKSTSNIKFSQNYVASDGTSYLETTAFALVIFGT